MLELFISLCIVLVLVLIGFLFIRLINFDKISEAREKISINARHFTPSTLTIITKYVKMLLFVVNSASAFLSQIEI